MEIFNTYLDIFIPKSPWDFFLKNRIIIIMTMTLLKCFLREFTMVR